VSQDVSEVEVPAPTPNAATPPSAAPRGRLERPPETPDPLWFQTGREAAMAKQWKRAVEPLHAFYERAPATDDNRTWAELYLAQSLRALGFKHAASVFYADLVQERSNPEVIPAAVEALKVLSQGPHDELLVEEATFSNLDVASLSSTLAAYVLYQQGMRQLLAGRDRWADTFFKRIPAGTPEETKARYAKTISKIKTPLDITPALEKELETLAGAPELEREVKNEVLLAIARMHYERKEYDAAIATYRRVELAKLSPGRASLYLEEAWSRYRMGQLREAMALLVVLDAPSFRKAFLPDKYLLKAFIYRDLCQYLPAKRAVKGLRRQFADTLAAIQEREDLSEHARLVQAATAEGRARSALRFRDQVKAERAQAREWADSLGPKLAARLRDLYDTAYSEAERRYQQQLSAALENKAELLLGSAEQARLMDYEIGLKLYERIRTHGVSGGEEKALVARTSDTVSFPFKGEYWNDELRSYRFSLESRCSEEGRP
jgi:hypothetical protein